MDWSIEVETLSVAFVKKRYFIQQTLRFINVSVATNTKVTLSDFLDNENISENGPSFIFIDREFSARKGH